MKWTTPLYRTYAKLLEICVSRKFISLLIVALMTINGYISEECFKYTVIGFIGMQGLIDFKKSNTEDSND